MKDLAKEGGVFYRGREGFCACEPMQDHSQAHWARARIGAE